jgi:ABC-2 family transporter protein
MTTLAVRRLPRMGGLPWVTWRQSRLALAGVVALLGGAAILMLLLGRTIHDGYATLGLNQCADFTTASCHSRMELFLFKYEGWGQFLPRILEFVPAVIGVFVGAPLVARELESGTFRFAWTQGRSRVQWLIVKLVLVGVTLTVLALGFSQLFTWWFKPFIPSMGRMNSGQAYEVLGIVFAARTLFAFALGVLLGAIIRRTVPAMAATMAGWLAVAWPSVLWLRPLIQKPVTVPANSNLITQNGWVIHDWVQDASGHHLTTAQEFGLAQASAAAKGGGGIESFDTWLTQHHYSEWVSFQPDSRFWHFQVIEASCYVALALILAAAAVMWVRRRAA